MRKVINLAQYPVTARLDGEFYRFNGRETKILPTNLVTSDEFKQYSTLKDAGIHYRKEEPIVEEITPEIKSSEPEATIPETPEQEQAEVLIVGEVKTVDDKQAEVEIVEDVEVEEKPKTKRKRKSTATK